MSREGAGDWMCGACQHINFKKREACQRCSCPKYATQAEAEAYAAHKAESTMLAGDWYCGAMNCGAHNYASRSTCYRCGSCCGYGAGIMASAGYAGDAIPGWKTGDWICTRYVALLHFSLFNFFVIIIFKITIKLLLLLFISD